MEQYFWVFFSPKGRLPRDLYYVYAIPAWAALWLLSRHISMELADAAENGTPAEPWLLVPLALLYWMQACVTSRRLHDCSYTGALPVGIAAVLLFDATTGYFPDMLGVGDEVRENSQSVIDILFFAARIAFRLTCTAALFKEGDSGENGYGQPLGTRDPNAAQSRTKPRKQSLDEEYAEALQMDGKSTSDLVNRMRAAPASNRSVRRRAANQSAIPSPEPAPIPVSRPRKPGEFGRRYSA